MSSIEIRSFTAADKDWLLTQHRDHYARVEGFDESFGLLVGEILDAFIRDHVPGRDAGWIAQMGDARLGSVFCVHRSDTTAQLRLFYLVPEARGQGLGKRLLQGATDHARALGYREFILWTHESHRAAGALYKAAGWELVDSTPAVSFGQEVVVQNWRIDL